MTGHVRELLSQFSGQMAIVTIPAVYIRFTGSMESAALLSQILYWSDRTKDPDGWFHKSYSEWESEIALSEYQVRKHSKKFAEQGFLEIKLKKINGAPKVHYRINWDIFSESILKFLRNGNQRNFGILDSEVSSESKPKKLRNPINKETKTTNKDYSKTTLTKEGEDALQVDFEPTTPCPSSQQPPNDCGRNQKASTAPAAPARSGYEYGNKAQQMEHRFSGKQFPWTGDSAFVEWLVDNWPWSNEGDKREVKIANRRSWMRKCEQSWRIDDIQDRWEAYQADNGSVGVAAQDVQGQILKELQRLGLPSVIPDYWQERTGVVHFKDLSSDDAIEYLAHLRSQGGAA